MENCGAIGEQMARLESLVVRHSNEQMGEADSRVDVIANEISIRSFMLPPYFEPDFDGITAMISLYSEIQKWGNADVVPQKGVRCSGITILTGTG
jgi:hypothetical protein